MPTPKRPKPTESETEILQILWERGPSSVRAIHEALLRTKDSGYTTTLKLMQIMLDKGLLKREDSSRVHVYRPVITRRQWQRLTVNRVIDKLFKGSTAKLVLHALGNHRSSPRELEEIREYLSRLEPGNGEKGDLAPDRDPFKPNPGRKGSNPRNS